MASPHVAGVAALIAGAGVTKPDALEEILLGSARKPRAGTGGAGSGRIDDHFGAGVVDADAALRRIRGRRGVGELGLGATLALLGVSFLSRRGRHTGRVGVGFMAALIVGSSGLFIVSLLPSWFGADTGIWNVLGSGVLDGADALLRPALRGSPLVWSALLPVGLTVLLYGFQGASGRWRDSDSASRGRCCLPRWPRRSTCGRFRTFSIGRGWC